MTEQEAIKALKIGPAATAYNIAIDLAIEALEKQIPQKPVKRVLDDGPIYCTTCCPNCEEWISDMRKPYRCTCGQAIDWRDDK